LAGFFCDLLEIVMSYVKVFGAVPWMYRARPLDRREELARRGV
jgi:hypothetical protein